MAKVLIVEDERILAMKTRMDLVNMGHLVTAVVDNGIDALEATLNTTPDIILMDIVIKGHLNGIQTTGLICEQYFDCKVIYMTAHRDEDTVSAARKTKHKAILFKPVEDYELRDAIGQALAN